jgi:cellulose synthase/poly-beta-1,6-N-acetylglucosamine synthase-like glycosyltransferase
VEFGINICLISHCKLNGSCREKYCSIAKQMGLISGFLTGSVFLIAVPTLVLFTEVVAGCFFPRRQDRPVPIPGQNRVAVLVPAHNEGEGVLQTLVDVKAQLRATDRLLVVADNCSDNTASVAVSAGAEVIVRNDLARRGKAYALEFGLSYLATDPPHVVIIIDADCRVKPGSIALLVDTCLRTSRPAQALDLMVCAPGATSRQRVAEFAWRVKNWARPLGLHALGLPCQLMGTGMAFPWAIIAPATIKNDLVEDIRMGLDLSLAGHPPIFCPAALVTSEFPASHAAIETQRQRWEHGHLGAMLTIVPKSIVRAIVHRNIGLFTLAFDLLVPPVSLLVAATIMLWIVTSLAAVAGYSPWPVLLCTINVAFLFTALLLAWLDYARDILPVRALGASILYVLGKFPLYRDFLAGQATKQWIKTGREKGGK